MIFYVFHKLVSGRQFDRGVTPKHKIFNYKLLPLFNFHFLWLLIHIWQFNKELFM